MLTVEYLQEQIKQLESDEAQMLANANASRGAIQMCRQILKIMQEQDNKEQQEAIHIRDLEKKLGVKLEEPQPINP
jgi:hypothetical protein